MDVFALIKKNSGCSGEWEGEERKRWILDGQLAWSEVVMVKLVRLRHILERFRR